MQYSVSFPGGTVKYLFNASVGDIATLADVSSCILITDACIADLYRNRLGAFKTVVIPTGEENKNWQVIESIANELLSHETHRSSFIIGLGGGVITDITGFIASVYMRGVPFGLAPTSLLAMVDAAVGGKNGVNMGLHKNFLGTIQQPQFVLYDTSFLKTLPESEWSNGFAEIIKYACLFDKDLFNELEQHDINYYRENEAALQQVIMKCVDWKNKIVLEDEKESSSRKLLNFGHTAGHALETAYQLPHGHAISIGMIIACIVSEKVAGLNKEFRMRLASLLQQYQLPVSCNIEIAQVMDVLKMDKKRNAKTIDYIVLNKIGKAAIMSLSFDFIEQALESFADAGDN